MAFGAGESPMLNHSPLVNPNNLLNNLNHGNNNNNPAAAAAAARSAKVKSDLLMGLNAGFRPERLSAMKESSSSSSSGFLNQQQPPPGMQPMQQQQQHYMPVTTLSQEHSNMLNNLNGIRPPSELLSDSRIK